MNGDPASVLEAECERVSEVVLGLSEAEFSRPTRCPPWDVKVLLAHMWRDMDRLRSGLGQPAPAAPDTTSVDYWRSYDPVTDAPSISDRAIEVAGTHSTGAELARDFEANWREGIAAARREPVDRVIATWGPLLRLGEFLRTRILEIAVHGLDLAQALEREPWITEGGSAETRAILVGLLGQEPPPALGWDDLTFIEAGTGRRPFTNSERDLLGTAAGRFPLLG